MKGRFEEVLMVENSRLKIREVVRLQISNVATDTLEVAKGLLSQ